MAQYINKSALVAEIERRIDRNNENAASYSGGSEHDYLCRVKEKVYKDLLSFLDTLETKEVELETAFAASIDHFDEKNNYGQWPESDLRQFAEHFFELGLKTQKEQFE